jgi:hypothetical protein
VLHVATAVSWSPDGKYVSYLTKERAVYVCNSKFESQYTFNLPAEIGDVTENLQGKYKLKTLDNLVIMNDCRMINLLAYLLFTSVSFDIHLFLLTNFCTQMQFTDRMQFPGRACNVVSRINKDS